MELTDTQWTRLEPIILQSVCKKDTRGRKPRDPREVLNGRVGVLRTGAPWKDLPDRCTPHQTCHRRFQQWTKAGVFRRMIEELAVALTSERHSLTAALFRPKTGQREQNHGNYGRGRFSCCRLPCKCVMKLAETALDSLFIAEKPEKLIGDKAYDSDKLDDNLLKKHGIEMIAPHRRNRTKPKTTQDGRKLRRYQRRWKVERLFAWLQNFRRLVVRYERYADNFLVFSTACLLSYFASFFLR